MKYAVDYRPVGDSVVFAWEEGGEPVRMILKSGKTAGARTGVFGATKKVPKKIGVKVASEMSTADFFARLEPSDVIFTGLGGQNDKFCIAASRKNVKLLRLPTNFVHDEQERQRKEESKKGEAVEEAASILYRFARSIQEEFYPFREADLPYLEVRLLSRLFWTVQRSIRITIANRLRHVTQDLEFLGGPEGFPVTKQAIESILMTVPEEEGFEIDPEQMVAIKFFKSLEVKVKRDLERALDVLPLYNAVFKPLKGNCGPGIAGYVIGQIIDIRRFPTFAKLKAFAGYHLVKNEDGEWVAPRPMKGQRANWDHVLQQAVYYFTSVSDKQAADHLWKQQLQIRYGYEIEKLLRKVQEKWGSAPPDVQAEEAKALAGKNVPVPAEMTIERFLGWVQALRTEAAGTGGIAKLPEPYKGIPVVARKRALRWLGQKFLQYVWTEWHRFEGLPVPEYGVPLFPVGLQVDTSRSTSSSSSETGSTVTEIPPSGLPETEDVLETVVDA